MSIELFATACFALAILHTLFAPRLGALLTLLGEVELVFILWAAVYLVGLGFYSGIGAPPEYLRTLSFREPLFVFVLMTASGTRPILHFAERLIERASRLLPFTPAISFYAVTLTLGPLLGSFITEPAAMTVTALILRRRFFAKHLSARLMYATLGLLFVNVSIGGTMTTFAAPPVLMVAEVWGWDSIFMLKAFAWKAAFSCVLSTALVTRAFYGELSALGERENGVPQKPIPVAVTLLHLLALLGIVAVSHHLIGLAIGAAIYIGLIYQTRVHQHKFRVRAAAMVALFLGGLVILGPPQSWWLAKVLASLHGSALFLGAALLTGIIDNAALTYLGAQVPHLLAEDKVGLVAGAVVGGGLTILANAPNPAGYGILKDKFKQRFGRKGLNPAHLLLGALPPTVVAGVCLYCL